MLKVLLLLPAVLGAVGAEHILSPPPLVTFSTINISHPVVYTDNLQPIVDLHTFPDYPPYYPGQQPENLRYIPGHQVPLVPLVGPSVDLLPRLDVSTLSPPVTLIFEKEKSNVHLPHLEYGPPEHGKLTLEPFHSIPTTTKRPIVVSTLPPPPSPLPRITVTAPPPLPRVTVTAPPPLPRITVTAPPPLPRVTVTAPPPLPRVTVTAPPPLPRVTVTAPPPLPVVSFQSTTPRPIVSTTKAPLVVDVPPSPQVPINIPVPTVRQPLPPPPPQVLFKQEPAVSIVPAPAHLPALEYGPPKSSPPVPFVTSTIPPPPQFPTLKYSEAVETPEVPVLFKLAPIVVPPPPPPPPALPTLRYPESSISSGYIRK